MHLNRRTNKISHTYKELFGTRLVFICQCIPKIIETNGICVWRCTEALRFNTLISPLLQLIFESTKLENFLSMEAIDKSIIFDQTFCLNTLQLSHSYCVYTIHSTLTGCTAGHQVRALHSLIYYSLMSPNVQLQVIQNHMV